MRRFAELYEALDSTTSTNAKVAALVRYFRTAPPEDAVWGLYFLVGRRLKRLLPVRQLADWTLELSGVPDWLFDESYGAVGDLAELIALLVDAARKPEKTEDVALSTWLERLEHLRGLPPEEQREHVLSWWRTLSMRELFLLIKMTTGELRVGASATLVIRAVAEVAGLSPGVISHRLMGDWVPTAEFFKNLLQKESTDDDRSRPYPFYLASPLEDPIETLGSPDAWQIEWKWDGIRSQLIQRDGHVFIWSRGEELITDRFPELRDEVKRLPTGTVIDGEIMAWRDGPLPFSVLQKRIGRQKLSAKILEDAPAAVLAYDLLEENGQDIRALPLSERRARLEKLLSGFSPRFHPSEVLKFPSWDEYAKARGTARERGVEGLMLKRLDSEYLTGRKRGDWWKWKIDPFTVDAVLVYAQPGNGRRATLFTDLTFAVWQDGELLPVAKAYSGLSDEEIAELDGWVRRHTIERFGPVRAVEPLHVFEIAFEGIGESPRHKSGIAVRFPRISRWRRDKKPADADSLNTLRELIKSQAR
ncbi:MAG: ATP-dependent DNA ligase [Myxococcaceae bacterium]